MLDDSWPLRSQSQLQAEAYREMQNEAFHDLADECETCGYFYVENTCPMCLKREDYRKKHGPQA